MDKEEIKFVSESDMEVMSGIVTKFYRVNEDERNLMGGLCIEQEGNKVYLRKNHIDRLPALVERWKIR